MAPRASLTAVVLARDEAAMIEGCLRRLDFADEILVGVDRRTTDDTAERAASLGARIVPVDPGGFASMRNQLLAHVHSNYAFFVDADERVTGDLRAEICMRLAAPPAAYRVPIANWFYGHRVRRTGYRERPLRLLPMGDVQFRGDIHETPTVARGLPERQLRSPLVHMSHRSITENLRKTARYADVQAAELFANGHPRVTRRTLLRVLARALLRHLVVGQGFRDGTAGFVESFYQPLSHFCVYVRLWEMQQHPSIEQRYAQLDAELR